MKVYTYFNKQRVRSDGAIPIYIVVYRPPKRLMIHTGLFSNTEFPDTVFPRSEKNYKAKSVLLQRYVDDIELIALENSLMPNDDLKALIQNKLFGKPVFDNNLASVMRKYGDVAKKPRTKELYYNTASKIDEYDSSATLDIGTKWLDGFYCNESSKGNSDNTIAIDMRNIRRVMNWAIENEWTDNYPFRKYKIRKTYTRKRNLVIDKLRHLMFCDIEKEHIVRYRDLFNLMFYLIGVNAVDLLTAKKEQVVDGRFEYDREKTGKHYSVKIEPEAQAIIDKYAGKDYLLCFCDTSQYKNIVKKADMYLKEIIDGVSTYYARHSWATIASDLDIPIDTISAALGHSHGNEITNIYINFDQKKVDAANRKVIDYVFGIGEFSPLC